MKLDFCVLALAVLAVVAQARFGGHGGHGGQGRHGGWGAPPMNGGDDESSSVSIEHGDHQQEGDMMPHHGGGHRGHGRGHGPGMMDPERLEKHADRAEALLELLSDGRVHNLTEEFVDVDEEEKPPMEGEGEEEENEHRRPHHGPMNFLGHMAMRRAAENGQKLHLVEVEYVLAELAAVALDEPSSEDDEVLQTGTPVQFTLRMTVAPWTEEEVLAEESGRPHHRRHHRPEEPREFDPSELSTAEAVLLLYIDPEKMREMAQQFREHPPRFPPPPPPFEEPVEEPVEEPASDGLIAPSLAEHLEQLLRNAAGDASAETKDRVSALLQILRTHGLDSDKVVEGEVVDEEGEASIPEMPPMMDGEEPPMMGDGEHPPMHGGRPPMHGGHPPMMGDDNEMPPMEDGERPEMPPMGDEMPPMMEDGEFPEMPQMEDGEMPPPPPMGEREHRGPHAELISFELLD